MPAKAKPAVPDLASTPALDIGSEDVALPRIYVGQSSSKAVEDDLVAKGTIYSASNGDDPEPKVLYDPKNPDDKGVLVHVLSMFRAKSLTHEGQLTSWAFNDPDAPPESWVTYNYVVICPELDLDLPYKLLLTKSSTPAAKAINTVLKRAEANGPSYLSAFRLTTAPRENDKGKFYIVRARAIEAEQQHIEASSDLVSLIQPAALALPASSAKDEPSI